VYRTADSVIISAAKRGAFEAPGNRDTRRIRVTIIMVERLVVPTDKAKLVSAIALPIFAEIQTGTNSMTKYAMPVAEVDVN
jgi:hypothetical protein